MLSDVEVRARSALLRHAAAGATAAFALGVADAGFVIYRAGGLSFVRSLEAIVVMVGLYLPFGTLLGVLLGLAYLMVRKAPELSRRSSPSFSIRKVLMEPRPRPVATFVSASLVVAVCSAALCCVALMVSERVVRQHFVAVAVALALPILAGVLTPFFWRLRGALTTLFERRPILARPLNLVVLGALGIGALAIVWYVFRHEAWASAFDRSGLAPALGIGTLAYMAVFYLSEKTTRARFAQLCALFAVLGSAAVGIGLGRIDGSSNVRNRVNHDSRAGHHALGAYRSATDWDRDGYSALFRPRDCRPFDPKVHPNAFDPPGDGIDSDCFEYDPNLAILRPWQRNPPHYDENISPPNIVLITVDALRPDHLGAHGYERDTSPNIDAFAASAVRFDDAMATSSRSVRSIPPMLSGRYASQLSYGPESYYFSILPENEMLAEMLVGAGYETAAVMGTNYFEQLAGLFQGFNSVEHARKYFPRRSFTRTKGLAALRRLRRTGRPFFLWVHHYEVHAPYLRDQRESDFGPGQMAAYDTEIKFVDSQIGPILRELDRPELANTVVVIASDHGEAFGEHGQYMHSSSLYNEQIRSVLMIRAPGVNPTVVSETVTLLDLTPTLLNFAGLAPPPGIQARSLLDQMRGEPVEDRPIISEMLPDGRHPHDERALFEGEYKLIWSPISDSVRLFNLVRDPDELVDLSEDEERLTNRMLKRLRAWVAHYADARSQSHALVDAARIAEVPELDHPLRLDFGNWRFLGYQLPETTIEDRTIPYTFYYECIRTEQTGMRVNIRFDGARGEAPFFDESHVPVHGVYPLPRWKPGDIIKDEISVVVPVGVRRPSTLQPVLRFTRPRGLHTTRDGRDSFELPPLQLR